MTMKFILTVPFFDGFEGYFNDELVIDADNLDDAKIKASNFQKYLQKRSDAGHRPYIEGEIEVKTVDEWMEEHKMIHIERLQ